MDHKFHRRFLASDRNFIGDKRDEIEPSGGYDVTAVCHPGGLSVFLRFFRGWCIFLAAVQVHSTGVVLAPV
jgi:hypothetical protein